MITATAAEKFLSPNGDGVAPTNPVKGRTTEAVLRDLVPWAEANGNTDPAPIILALVARYDARAAKRAAKATDDEAE